MASVEGQGASTRRRTDPTVGEVASWMASEFPAGLVREDGVVVGMWHCVGGVGCDRGSVKVLLATRARDHLPRAGSLQVHRDRLDGLARDPLAALSHGSRMMQPAPPGSSAFATFLECCHLAVRWADVSLDDAHVPGDLPSDVLSRKLGDMIEDAAKEFGLETTDPRLATAAMRALDAQRGKFAAFAATLSPGLASVLSEFGPQPWIGVSFHDVEDGVLSRAIADAPWACQALLKAWGKGGGRREFRMAVTEGRCGELAHRALIANGLGEAAARAMPMAYATRRHPAPDLPAKARDESRQAACRGDVPASLAGLSWLPDGWWPRDEDGWRALWSCLKPAKIAASRVRDPSETRDLVDVHGDWPGYLARLLAATGEEDASAILHRMADAQDMAGAFEAQVVLPGLAIALGATRDATAADIDLPTPGGTRDLAVDMLRNGQTLVKTLSRSRAWHARRMRVDHGVAALPGNVATCVAWPAGLPDRSFDGVDVVVLTDKSSLVDEGRRGPDASGMDGLDHCVGGYARRCARDGVRILSFRGTSRDGTRLRLATAEVVLDDGRLKVCQIMGHANRAPPPAAVAAMQAYAGLVGNGALTVDRAGLEPRPDLDTVAGEAGYEWWRKGAWDAIMALWAPSLPRNLGDLTPKSILAALQAQVVDASGRSWRREPFVVGPAVDAPDPVPGP